MKYCAEIYLSVALLFVLFIKHPLITQIANSILGKLFLLTSIYLVTHSYGIKAGILTVIISIILMNSDLLEGIDDTLDDSETPKETVKETGNDDDEEDDEDDEEDKDNHTKSDQLDVENALKSDLITKHSEDSTTDEPEPAPLNGKTQEGFSVL